MIVIHDYDEFKAHVLKLREGAAAQTKNSTDPAARSFANGLVFAYDQVFAALMAWESFCCKE